MVWGGGHERSRPWRGGQNLAAPTCPGQPPLRPRSHGCSTAAPAHHGQAPSAPTHPGHASVRRQGRQALLAAAVRAERGGTVRPTAVRSPSTTFLPSSAHAGSADRAPAATLTAALPWPQVWTTGARWPAGSAGAGVGDGRQGHAGNVFCAYWIQGQRCAVQAAARALRAAGQAGAPAASSRPRDDGLVALATPAPSPFL